MQGKMKVAVMTGPKKMEWILRDIPQPAPGEVQVKLEYVGVCGSDLHFYSEGRLGNWVPNGPLVLGHEPGGIVTDVGEGVTSLKIGDRVAIEPGVGCGHCKECLEGHYNLCKEVKFMAIPNEKDGVFSEYCTHPASMSFKIPDNMSTMAGALIEPLAVGMHACELSNARIGESAVILGSGCIGLTTLMSLKARGVSEIYVADILDKRLEKAKELGATKIFNLKNENLQEFIDSLPEKGVDQVYECAGNKSTTLLASKLAKFAGKITLVGVSPEPILELDIATMNAREVTLYTVYRYRNLYAKSIKAVADGLIPVEKIVSHVYDFENVIEAVDYNLNHKEEVIKAVIKM